ncbi:hypothetical protein [Ornithinimicrobium kibberense]|uniref:hypothetical protein n=1 Tax=Ornithinimicrobium kibberense TaxID=282060 RepID=UPI003621C25B
MKSTHSGGSPAPSCSASPHSALSPSPRSAPSAGSSDALYWHPSMSRRRWEGGSRLGGGESGKWLVRRAGSGL